jgi:hypothetical protein
MTKEKLSQKQFFSEWLEKLQQESWQLELLISGFALFGVWESHDYLVYIQDYITAHTSGQIESVLHLVMYALLVGWVIFFTNLLVHIIFRGLWIGAIGLRYVSGDIEYDKFNYSEVFTNHIKTKVGDFDSYIEKLEKFSSVLFSYTFLLFFLFLSFILILAEFSLLILLTEFILNSYESTQTIGILLGIILIVFILCILFIILDFVTLGGFRKIKEPTMAKIYLSLYKVFNILTLSFLYRPLIYNFLDQKYTKRLYLMGIPYGILISLVFPNFVANSSSLFPNMMKLDNKEAIELSRYYINPNYYDDLRTQQTEVTKTRDQIFYISLESHDIDNDFVKVFFRFQDNDEHLFDSLGLNTSPYTHIGLKHKLFKSSYLREDPILDSIKLENSRERLVMKKVLYDFELNEDEIDSSYINKYKGYPKDSIWKLSNKINTIYKPALEEQKENRHVDIIEAMQNIHIAKVDTLNVAIEKCMYFTHPNLEEKGVLCYLNISDIQSGPHELFIERKVYSSYETYSTMQFYIPFFKK